jgi:hypothetical protein
MSSIAFLMNPMAVRLMLFCILTSSALSMGQSELVRQVKSLLPAGAALETLQCNDAAQISSSCPAITSVERGGQVTSAFAFSLNGQLRIGMSVSGSSVLTQAALPGTYVQRWTAAPHGVLLKPLLPGGPLTILVASAESASAGTYFNILGINRDRLVNLTAETIGGADARLNCPSGEACKVIVYGSWTDFTSATVGVYEWNRGTYVRTEAGVAAYVESKYDELASDAVSLSGAAPGLRVALAEMVATHYLSKGDTAAAISFCQAVLARLKENRQAEPGKVQLALSLAHGLLGRVYQSAGRMAEAEGEFVAAKQFRNQQRSPAVR